MSDPHPLDHPIWTSLITRQAHLAEGGERARRFPLAYTPFAAIADTSRESFNALRALLAPGDHAVLFTVDPVEPPPPFTVLSTRTGEQMIGAPADVRGPLPEIVTLGEADVTEMAALVELTKPGPFASRTRELGTFLGIRIDGRLAAMTGERMKPGEYTEMTAVCTHPDFRGRGYAQVLLAAVARQIEARGEVPFLHVFSDNTAAIALYHRQGMEIRRRVHVTVLGLTP